LRQELANRDAEVRDLRAKEREQVKVLQETTREAARAKVKLRRLATQVDAASYLAEVEVALQSQRTSPGASTNAPLLALAQGLLEATAAPFAQGDYGSVMDRTAQAEQLGNVAADNQVRSGSRPRPRAPGEVAFQVAISLKVTIDSNLRRQPLPKSPIVSVLRKDSPLVAHAWKGNWMRVETADGRSGWVDQAQLGAQ